jgi:hypothetical protein
VTVRNLPMETALVAGTVVGALTMLLIVGALVFDYPRWVPFVTVVLMTPIFLIAVWLAKERRPERGKTRSVTRARNQSGQKSGHSSVPLTTSELRTRSRRRRRALASLSSWDYSAKRSPE